MITHTHYFGADDPEMAALCAAIDEVRSDIESRLPFEDATARHAMERRRDLLLLCAGLLLERAD